MRRFEPYYFRITNERIVMMKRMLLGLYLILFTSFCPYNDCKDFHIQAVGIEKVRQFELDFPQIVNDRVVYIAYLQKYYKGRERIFIQLLK